MPPKNAPAKNTPTKNVKPKYFQCPFPDCDTATIRLYNLKTHLSAIRGMEGDDEIHPRGHEAWDRAKELGYLTINTRPGNLNPEEAKRRKSQNSKKYRVNHRDELVYQRRERTKDLQAAARLAKRAAKIALRERSDRLNAYKDARHQVYQDLFRTSALASPTSHPKQLLCLDSPVTIDTFPLFVTIFIPPAEWPNVTPLDKPDTPLVNQIPGDSEYHRLSLIFQPNRTASLDQNNGGRGRGHGRGRRVGFNSGPSRGMGDNRTPTQALGLRRNLDNIQPDNALSTHLNSAYDIWRVTVRTPALQQEMYMHLHDDPHQFASKSVEHRELFQSWTKISRQVVNALCPPGRSVMEVHYFINARASTPILDPRLESEDDEDDEEGAVLDLALKLKAKKKHGRQKKIFEENSDEGESAEE